MDIVRFNRSCGWDLNIEYSGPGTFTHRHKQRLLDLVVLSPHYTQEQLSIEGAAKAVSSALFFLSTKHTVMCHTLRVNPLDGSPSSEHPMIPFLFGVPVQIDSFSNHIGVQVEDDVFESFYYLNRKMLNEIPLFDEGAFQGCPVYCHGYSVIACQNKIVIEEKDCRLFC